MRYLLSFCSVLTFLINTNLASADIIQINFTANVSYSIEVAHIDIGDTIEWLPKNKGHNVEFLAGPKMDALPAKSEIDAFHSIIFEVPGLYLYQCTPHGNMGMLGLVVVGNDFHNLEDIKKTQLSRVATSVMNRLVKTAQLN